MCIICTACHLRTTTPRVGRRRRLKLHSRLRFLQRGGGSAGPLDNNGGVCTNLVPLLAPLRPVRGDDAGPQERQERAVRELDVLVVLGDLPSRYSSGRFFYVVGQGEGGGGFDLGRRVRLWEYSTGRSSEVKGSAH